MVVSRGSGGGGKRSERPGMRTRRDDNFVDKSFTVMADMILKFMPTSKEDKEAFAYYRDGMAAQGDGDYAEALENYTESLKLEKNPMDRTYVHYNIGLIKQANGDLEGALESYASSLEDHPRNLSAMNNSAVISFEFGLKAEQEKRFDEAEVWFDRAAELWKKAVRIAPNNYIEAQNWLKTTGRADLY
jgi:tetratricopeptide (TPR) repeat protein